MSSRSFNPVTWLPGLSLRGLILGAALAGLPAIAAPSAALANPLLQPSAVQGSRWLLSQASGGVLQLNDANDEVTQLQTRLKELGYYDGPITGTFGPLTQEAVINFQQAQGLTADGIAGPATLTALSRAGAASTPSTASATSAAPSSLLQLGDTGLAVTTLQQQLAAQGYYQGTVDGTFGPQTEAAVLAFQQSKGLAADGIAGPATIAALNSTAQPTVAAQPAQPIQPAAQPSLPATSELVTTPPPVDPAVPSSVVITETPPAIVPTAPSVATVPPIAPAAPLPPPSAGVLSVQKQLADRGLYQGPLDGVMDLETQQSIQQAQQNYGLNSSDWAP